jgi:seryl-tRNA synthetase
MISLQLIRDNPDLVKKNLEKRKDEEKLRWVDKVLELDAQWKKLKKEVDDLRHERNELSREIGKLKKAGKDTNQVMQRASVIPEEMGSKEEEKEKLENEIHSYLMKIPNILHESVPFGESDEDNQEIRKWGEPRKFDFELKSHVEIVENLNVADFERSAKLSGHGFYFMKGNLALLNRALLQFAIDFMVKKGYTYTEPPLMMRKKPYSGVVDLSDFEDVMYKIEGEDLYLIATSEHPLTAQFMDEVFEKDQLPIKLTGYSMCFRKEVGSSGIDTKGFFRTHQFNKVEQIIICNPDESWELHEELQKNTEEMLQLLELPYRVVNVCTGDLGNLAAKKYDTEVWMPRQKKYREVGSNSNCTDYQARRLNIKIGKLGSGNFVFAHTLNNTAIATSRVPVAILENYQQKDGSVKVPKVLQKYMGGVDIIGKE